MVFFEYNKTKLIKLNITSPVATDNKANEFSNLNIAIRPHP